MKRATSFLHYTHAVVRGVPNSFCAQAIRRVDSDPIDLARARHQLDVYVQNLKTCGVKVTQIGADEMLPDCPFVEDTAVAVGSRVLLTRPGHRSRRQEVMLMRDCLKNTLGVSDVHEMMSMDSDAVLDGGDVLFTGREFFVGQSARTNASGLRILAETFPEFPVTGILVVDKLHLQDVATMAGDDIIICVGDDNSRNIYKEMKSHAKFPYKFIEVDTDVAVNVLTVNGHVFHKTKQELGEVFYKTVMEKVKGKLLEVPFSEFSKADGSLTCCSLLLNLDQ